MQCPKCGVYLEDDRDTCFMCGTKITNTPESNLNNEFSNNTEINFNSDYLAKKEEYENRFNDYKNVNIDDYNNDKPDIFDIIGKHKRMFKTIAVVVVILIVTLIVSAIVKYKIDSKKTKPILIDLYYEIDETFNVQEGKNAIQYSKTVNGSQCTITINAVKDASASHAAQYFIEMKKNIEPTKDKDGNIVNELDEYIEKAGRRTVNGSVWETLGISYRPDATSTSYSLLKYKYLSSTHNDYSYDIVFINEKNNQNCAIDLEKFTQSLKFIEKE